MLSIVTPDDLDNEFKLFIRGVIRKAPSEKNLCLILRHQMMRIYKDYKNRFYDDK